MSDAVIATGVVAVAVFGFAPQNSAMLAAGAERTLKPVFDGIVSSLCGVLLLFALALAALYSLPLWLSKVSMVLASLLLALAGLSRYLNAPDTGHPTATAGSWLPSQTLRNPESWAVAVFLAGSTLNGSVTLAAAFAGLTVLTAFALAVWAIAGWSGCAYLTSGWHRRHLDWAFGILMVVAALASLVPAV